MNNLDLVVQDPSGKLWVGNAFLTSGKPDDANNVQEVYIPSPGPGTYTVYVKGTNITQNTVTGASQISQDYALVYGQPLIQDVVQSVSKTVTLASGAEISLDNTQVSYEQDGQMVNWLLMAQSEVSGNQMAGSADICGSDIYLPPTATTAPPYAYLAGRTWQAQGVQLVNLGQNLMFTEINPARSFRRIFAYPGATSRVTVNGSAMDNADELPPSTEVRAVVNPSTQTVWSAAITFKEVDGFLDRVDQEQHQLFLIGNGQPLMLAPDVSLAYLDDIVDADPADVPFGAGATPAWDKLLTGIKLKLMLSPDNDQVMYAGACRQLAVGTITAVDSVARKIAFSSGSTYR